MTTPRNAESSRRVGAAGALNDALDRLEAAVEQETAILRENRAIDLAEFNQRKHQGLLEINRVLRSFVASDLERVERARVLRLVAKLEDNKQVLALHLQAVDEISALLAQVIRDAESDGTYGRRDEGGRWSRR